MPASGQQTVLNENEAEKLPRDSAFASIDFIQLLCFLEGDVDESERILRFLSRIRRWNADCYFQVVELSISFAEKLPFQHSNLDQNLSQAKSIKNLYYNSNLH